MTLTGEIFNCIITKLYQDSVFSYSETEQMLYLEYAMVKIKEVLKMLQTNLKSPERSNELKFQQNTNFLAHFCNKL